jgi:hypothetical protein
LRLSEGNRNKLFEDTIVSMTIRGRNHRCGGKTVKVKYMTGFTPEFVTNYRNQIPDHK